MLAASPCRWRSTKTKGPPRMVWRVRGRLAGQRPHRPPAAIAIAAAAVAGSPVRSLTSRSTRAGRTGAWPASGPHRPGAAWRWSWPAGWCLHV